MRILVLSNTPWDNNNSFGNTFSNLFEEIPDIEIANIYCRYGLPNNQIVSKYYQVTEKSLLENLRDSKKPSGREVAVVEQSTELKRNEQKAFDFVRTKRLQIFFWMRDAIWKIGRWKSPELKKFIDDFSPDVIYLPLYYSNYLLEIGSFLKQYTNVKMIGHVSDDIYTLRQLSFSPLFWIDRFIKRKKIRKVVEQCEFLHVISEIQKREYEKTFKKECRIFKKGLPFEEKNAPQHSLNSPIRFVYTGNIGNGRWETLADIGKVLKECNKDNVNAQLYIYSLTPLSKRMKEALEIPDTVFFMGGISEKEVKEVQKDADVLLHVEALNIKSRLSVHQSFSTKIVDYLHTGNCIFAVGTKDMASIDYLVRNKVAIVATNRQEIAKQIKDMLKEPEKILAYGVQGWDTGKKNHQKAETVKAFQADLESVLDWG